jgi:uncharacterized membrane protein
MKHFKMIDMVPIAIVAALYVAITVILDRLVRVLFSLGYQSCSIF